MQNEFLTPNDQEVIENELAKLYLYQGKNLQGDQREKLAVEIMGRGYPLKAILSGIRDLAEQDVSVLKLAIILNSIRRKIEPEEVGACDHCHKTGMVIFRDDQGRSFSLACQCASGAQVYESQRLVQWDGGAVQSVKNRLLTKAG